MCDREESSIVRPCVTVGANWNGVLNVTPSLYGQVGGGFSCCFTIPDSPKTFEIHSLFKKLSNVYGPTARLRSGVFLFIFNSRNLYKNMCLKKKTQKNPEK